MEDRRVTERREADKRAANIRDHIEGEILKLKQTINVLSRKSNLTKSEVKMWDEASIRISALSTLYSTFF